MAGLAHPLACARNAARLSVGVAVPLLLLAAVLLVLGTAAPAGAVAQEGPVTDPTNCFEGLEGSTNIPPGLTLANQMPSPVDLPTWSDMFCEWTPDWPRGANDYAEGWYRQIRFEAGVPNGRLCYHSSGVTSGISRFYGGRSAFTAAPLSIPANQTGGPAYVAGSGAGSSVICNNFPDLHMGFSSNTAGRLFVAMDANLFGYTGLNGAGGAWVNQSDNLGHMVVAGYVPDCFGSAADCGEEYLTGSVWQVALTECGNNNLGTGYRAWCQIPTADADGINPYYLCSTEMRLWYVSPTSAVDTLPTVLDNTRPSGTFNENWTNNMDQVAGGFGAFGNHGFSLAQVTEAGNLLASSPWHCNNQTAPDSTFVDRIARFTPFVFNFDYETSAVDPSTTALNSDDCVYPVDPAIYEGESNDGYSSVNATTSGSGLQWYWYGLPPTDDRSGVYGDPCTAIFFIVFQDYGSKADAFFMIDFPGGTSPFWNTLESVDICLSTHQNCVASPAESIASATLSCQSKERTLSFVDYAARNGVETIWNCNGDLNISRLQVDGVTTEVDFDDPALATALKDLHVKIVNLNFDSSNSRGFAFPEPWGPGDSWQRLANCWNDSTEIGGIARPAGTSGTGVFGSIVGWLGGAARSVNDASIGQVLTFLENAYCSAITLAVPDNQAFGRIVAPRNSCYDDEDETVETPYINTSCVQANFLNVHFDVWDDAISGDLPCQAGLNPIVYAKDWFSETQGDNLTAEQFEEAWGGSLLDVCDPPENEEGSILYQAGRLMTPFLSPVVLFAIALGIWWMMRRWLAG